MKVRVERDALADAVGWTARTLPKLSGALSGILIDAADETVALATYDMDVSSEASVTAMVEEAGRVLVSGRLLADIARALPSAPVNLESDSGRVVLTCGRSRFTLPLMPEEDYPPLPDLPPLAGTTSGAVFAQAVGQTFVATSKVDTLAVFTGIRMEIAGEDLTLAATDRYRLAVRELSWTPEAIGFEREVIVPGRGLSDVAKSLAGADSVHVALAADERSERSLGVLGDGRRFTTRLLDGPFPKFRDLLPVDFASSVRANVSELSDAIKRVALVAERNSPVRLNIGPDEIELRVGTADESQAVESVEALGEGTPMTIAFNPSFLLDGLHALDTPVAVMRYNEAAKPAVFTGAQDLTAEPSQDYRYLLMPVKV